MIRTPPQVRDREGGEELEGALELAARAAALGVRSGLGDEWLRLGGLKMAIDGGTSSHTALMYEPFEGESAVGDFTRMPPVELRRCIALAQELGWDVGIHTCGDRAMDLVVDAFADVAKTQPRPDARHNVIHAYFPTAEVARRAARLGVVVDTQPAWHYKDADALLPALGPERMRRFISAKSGLRNSPHSVLMARASAPASMSMGEFE